MIISIIIKILFQFSLEGLKTRNAFGEGMAQLVLTLNNSIYVTAVRYLKRKLPSD